MKKLKSRVLFIKQEETGRTIGFVHVNERGYIFGVAENDPRPKTPVFIADGFADEIQSGRIYAVDLVKGKKCFIAYNPNPKICLGSVSLEGNIISVKIGRSTLTWDKDAPFNKPSAFLAYCVNRKELKNSGDVFVGITDAFTKVGVDYTEC